MFINSFPLVLSVLYSGIAAAQTFHGRATIFNPGLSACAQTNDSNDFTAALSPAHFSSNICKKILVTNTKGSFSVSAVVGNLCPDCAMNDLRLPAAAIAALTGGGIGIGDGSVDVVWSFVD